MLSRVTLAKAPTHTLKGKVSHLKQNTTKSHLSIRSKT